MYENRIVRDYRDGRVSKAELDACSTCDLRGEICNGLSAASQAQLKDRSGEEIVRDDPDAQLNDAK